jgi:thiol-disulfide isomerase/thioredoxin
LKSLKLRGRVVLIRWWTDTCPFCAATAPALQKLQTKYGCLGLQVIGVFHPKPAGDWSVERVREAAKRLNMNFPVALDADWKALHR